jgi:tetratricopeptide (TPR) repeat protein
VVALFLVGFSLALKGLRRKLFWALGIAVALASFGFAAYVYSLDVPETPEPAIEATAAGAVALANDRFEVAIERYTEAIDVDDDFVNPYTNRAIATFLAANPDFRTTGAVTSAEGVATDAVDDLRTAVDLTDGDPDFLTLTIISLLEFYAGDFSASIQAADEAIARNDQVPDVRLLKSAAQVGLGDEAGAQETLDGALALLSGSDPSERTRALVADYITYLEYVAFLEPDRTEIAADFEQQIFARETAFTLAEQPSGTAPATGAARVEGLRYRNGRLQLTIDWRNLPADTQLSAIAFERPTVDGPWAQPVEAAFFRSVTGSGQEIVNAPLERACRPTEVRVDLYLNGERVQSETGPGGAPTC